jgi:hypothetical protein
MRQLVRQRNSDAQEYQEYSLNVCSMNLGNNSSVDLKPSPLRPTFEPTGF